MNEHRHLTGLAGVVTTSSSAVIAWLPEINLCVQIVAGIVAIIVGLFTIRYYHRKTSNLEKHNIKPKGHK